VQNRRRRELFASNEFQKKISDKLQKTDTEIGQLINESLVPKIRELANQEEKIQSKIDKLRPRIESSNDQENIEGLQDIKNNFDQVKGNFEAERLIKNNDYQTKMADVDERIQNTSVETHQDFKDFLDLTNERSEIKHQFLEDSKGLYDEYIEIQKTEIMVILDAMEEDLNATEQDPQNNA